METKLLNEIVKNVKSNLLYESYVLEENFFKKMALGASLITQLLSTQKPITPEYLKNKTYKLQNAVNALPDTSSKANATKILDDIQKMKSTNGSQVEKQIAYMVEYGKANGVYNANMQQLILDDKNDMLYYVKGGNIEKSMTVVTGADNGDVLDVDDYIEWLKSNKKSEIMSNISDLPNVVAKYENEFFQYVGKKITPSGFYKLEADPSYNLALYNIAYGKEMIKAQPESYGNIGVIQPTRVSDNKRQFWMLHGTQNSVRLQMLNANKDISKNMSMGCVNVSEVDNKFLYDLIKSKPNMALISLSEDGNSLIDISEGIKYVYGMTPKQTGTPLDTSNLPLKTPESSQVKITLYTLIRKVTPSNLPTTNPTVAVGGTVGGDTTNALTDLNKKLDLKTIKAQAKLAVDTEFARKYETTLLDDTAFLKSFRTFCVLTRNTYVNSVKKQNKELGDALKGQSVSSLNEGIFSRIKDSIMGLLGRKQKEIEVIEKKVDDTLGVAANKILKSGNPLSVERRGYMVHQAEIIKDIIVKKLDDFVTTAGSGMIDTKDSNDSGIGVGKSLNNDKKTYISNIKNARQSRRINELDKIS